MENNKMMIEKSKKGLFIVISGPSGVGKGTICSKIIDEFGAWYSISMTTRNKRDYEIDGKDYYFVNKEEFEDRINKGLFIEYATYNDNYYGTPKDKVIEHIDKGIDVIIEIEVKGAKQLKDKFDDAILIYVAPPSFSNLKERLLNRGTETEEEINKRTDIVKEEIKYLDNYDYVVINDDLDVVVNEVINIIKSEKLKTKRISKINIE